MNDPPPSMDVARTQRSCRGSQDIFAGIVVAALAVLFLWNQRHALDAGATEFGMPRFGDAVALGLGACGVLLAATAMVRGGPAIKVQSLRPIIFLAGAIAIFGFTVGPFGVALAAPLSMTFASFAHPDIRPTEAITVSVVVTLLGIAFFKYALGLPLPVIAFP